MEQLNPKDLEAKDQHGKDLVTKDLAANDTTERAFEFLHAMSLTCLCILILVPILHLGHAASQIEIFPLHSNDLTTRGLWTTAVQRVAEAINLDMDLKIAQDQHKAHGRTLSSSINSRTSFSRNQPLLAMDSELELDSEMDLDLDLDLDAKLNRPFASNNHASVGSSTLVGYLRDSFTRALARAFRNIQPKSTLTLASDETPLALQRRKKQDEYLQEKKTRLEQKNARQSQEKDEPACGVGVQVTEDDRKICICPITRVGAYCESFRVVTCSTTLVSPSKNCQNNGIQSEGVELESDPVCIVRARTESVQLGYKLSCLFTQSLDPGQADLIERYNVSFSYFARRDDEFAVENSTHYAIRYRPFNFYKLSDLSMSHVIDNLSASQLAQEDTIYYTSDLSQLPIEYFAGGRLYFEGQPMSRAGRIRRVHSREFIDLTDPRPVQPRKRAGTNVEFILSLTFGLVGAVGGCILIYWWLWVRNRPNVVMRGNAVRDEGKDKVQNPPQ